MPEKLLFIPLSKVDVEQRMVYGFAATEDLDKTSEIYDYESSKPNVEAWSKSISDATDGKSLGNVRSMHGNIAAGVLKVLNFNDLNKQVEVGAKIVDDGEWKKVQEGVYTGFSFGGKYARRWQDPSNPMAKRYTALPHELSLADNPCIPGATFVMVKAAGIEEKVEFKKVAAREDISEADKAAAEKEHGTTTEFADEKNKKYPINDAAHVRNAASRWGSAKNRAKYSAEDQKTIGAKIAAAKKKFGIGDESSAEKMTASITGAIGNIDRMHKVGAYVTKGDGEYFTKSSALRKMLRSLLDQVVDGVATEELKKGLYGVQSLASALATIDYITKDAEYENEAEGDDSEVPEMLAAVRKQLGDILVQMAQEEIAELDPEEEEDPMELTPAQKIAKAAELLGEVRGYMKKAAGDEMKHVQAIHDHAIELGAKPADDGEEEGEKDKKKSEKIAKLEGDLATMAKNVELLMGRADPSQKAPLASADLRKAAGEDDIFRPAGIGGVRGDEMHKAAGFLDSLKAAREGAIPVNLTELGKLAGGEGKKAGNLAILSK